jgi:hypothetical protein
MIYSLLKFVILLGLTITLRFVELSREVSTSIKGTDIFPDISVLYRLLYWHLGMSMVAIGLICDKLVRGDNNNPNAIILMLVVFLLTVTGCISRGMLSNRAPEVLSIYDRDWRLGIIIPDSLGLISLSLAIFI